MNVTRRFTSAVALAIALAGAVVMSLGASRVLAAQSAAPTRDSCVRDYQPQSGQAGKDVVWVPTNDRLVEKMLQMAQTTAADRVYDLGAGDGKIAIAAAKQHGATAVGVEYNPQMARLAQCFVQAEGVSNKVKIVQGDIFETDFTSATVVTLYLLPELNLRLRPTILKMKPGTRVVSHSFLMDDWEPDDRSMDESGAAYLWIVPANVDGTWIFRRTDGSDRLVIQLEQQFQNIKGTAGSGDARRPLSGARLRGPQIHLTYPDGNGSTTLSGRMNGDRIEATVTRGTQRINYVGTRS